MDYHNYCYIIFGVYLQELNKSKKTNTQTPRTIDTI